jgi:CubicO group peptidase (beta-lactamase class C family)
VAKSFSSTLLGIAAGEGRFSLDDPITRYLPELLERDDRFERIRVRDLLSMSSGIRYEETGFVHGDDAKTYYWPDLRSLALTTTEIAGAPGERFHYNNYNPLLEGMILERVTRVPVAKYLEERLWAPMGAEYRASWSLDSPGGFEKMESGINARAIDFARFGLLVLKSGKTGDRQVIPEQFLRQATAPSYPAGSEWYPDEAGTGDRLGYGLHWWTIDGPHGTDFAALGKYAQIIYVSPAAQLVIVRNGSDAGMPGFEWMLAFYDVAGELV